MRSGPSATQIHPAHHRGSMIGRIDLILALLGLHLLDYDSDNINDGGQVDVDTKLNAGHVCDVTFRGLNWYNQE